MNNLTTGIAVTLAIVVIGLFFIFPGLWPFGSSSSTSNQQGTPTTTGNEALQVSDIVVGSGAAVKAGDTLSVNYVGSFTDGSVFDASANHGGPFNFVLGAGEVIPGWDQGLVGMKVGGTRKLVVPPSLAYGTQGAGNVIPPNTTLVFTIQLLSVTPATTTPAQ